MALKGDRQVTTTSIRQVCNTAAEAGQIAIYDTQTGVQGSGQGLNDAFAVVKAVTGTPGAGSKVAGVFLSDVVNVDQTKYRRNPYTTAQVLGEPVNLLTDGFIWTNMLTGSTPTVGAPAYINTDSKFSTSQANSIAQVGKFLTVTGADGYACVSVKIP